MKNYYKDKKNVQEYFEMAEGYDGEVLIEHLRDYLPEGSTVLELGMGPGKDLDILNKYYQVTGSDFSKHFLEIYKENHKRTELDLLLLDARKLNIDRKFDCIYTNKVLYHLTEEELIKSLNQQKDLLNEEGLLLHSFWEGNKKEKFKGTNFVYYTKKKLIELINTHFADVYELLEIDYYKEMKDKDSIYVIIKKK
jgi:cyclopropane fatty-acyl-phospholipid synthase-like methyltransferase